MKCPQLSKPEATAARNQNSIGDRTEEKTLGETRLSRGAISPLARRHSSSIPTAAKSDCKGSTGSRGLVLMAEIHSRLSSLNGWVSKWCPQNNIGFIDNWTSFWGRPDLLKRDVVHPSWGGAALLSRNMAHSLRVHT